MGNFGQSLKKWAPTILSVAASGGVIATGIFAAKGGEKLSKSDETPTIRTRIKAFGPAIAVGAGTIGSIIFSNVLSVKSYAALLAMYGASKKYIERYRKRVDPLFGKGVDEFFDASIEDEENDSVPWDIPQTFYLDYAQKFFEATMDQVWQAEYESNHVMILRGYVTVNDFMTYLGQDFIPDGNKFGWMRDECKWIEFEHEHKNMDDMLVTDIQIKTKPINLYEPEF